MGKLIKEWVTPCTWNGWGCKNCDNRTITNRLYHDGFNFYTTSNGNGKNCISSEMDTRPNVGEILKDKF